MFEVLRNANGQYWWRLTAANNERLCHSEMYTTKQSAYDGITAVKRLGPDGPIIDRTWPHSKVAPVSVFR